MSDKIENVQRDLAMQEDLIARAIHQCLFGYGWKPSSDDISDLLSAYDRLRVELDAAIAERNRLRGRELTTREQLMNLIASLGEHDSDCSGKPCSCGADDFRAKFGPGKYTP